MPHKFIDKLPFQNDVHKSNLNIRILSFYINSMDTIFHHKNLRKFFEQQKGSGFV